MTVVLYVTAASALVFRYPLHGPRTSGLSEYAPRWAHDGSGEGSPESAIPPGARGQ